MKHVIIYIHGFNSGPGEKVTTLQSTFPDCEIIAPQLAYSPSVAIKQLQSIIESCKGKVVHVVGTSLGGFYTMYLSTIKSPEAEIFYYVINPSFTPQKSLQRYLNTTVTNYKTQEQFQVDWTFVVELATYQLEMVDKYSANCIHLSNYYIGVQDSVLDYLDFQMFIEKFDVPFRMYKSKQDHRFSDISPVINSLKINMAF
mgnify:CR=1 FL=1